MVETFTYNVQFPKTLSTFLEIYVSYKNRKMHFIIEGERVLENHSLYGLP